MNENSEKSKWVWKRNYNKDQQWNKVKSYFYVPNQNVGKIHLHYTKSNNSLREMNTSLKNIAISFLDLFVDLVIE